MCLKKVFYIKKNIISDLNSDLWQNFGVKLQQNKDNFLGNLSSLIQLATNLSLDGYFSITPDKDRTTGKGSSPDKGRPTYKGRTLEK